MPDKITQYVNNFLYTLSSPHIAEALLSSVDIAKLIHADVGTKLMSLGALLTSGNLEECIQLAGKLDFNDISPDDRSLLALIIFSKFYEHDLVDQNLAKPLKHILSSICPDALLAHKNFKEPSPQNSLIEIDYAKTISTSVCGAIFFSESIFGTGSRKCEAGYRIQKAFTSHGWDVSLFLISDIEYYSSFNQNDFAIIDVFLFNQMSLVDISNTLSRMRRYFRKIIFIDTDVWAGRFNNKLRSISDHIDYIWGFTADWGLATEPDFKDRCILFPYFGGFDHLDTIINAPLDWNTCAYNFTGSVQIYNLNRISWLLEFIYHHLPIEIMITSPDIDDGLDPVSSQNMYAQTVGATHAAINLTTRRDGSRPATGRSFEVISLNRLLIQECCPVFHRYFVEGEHFFEFSDITTLTEIIESIKAYPKMAKKVCSNGHQFYKEKYSCKKLVEHFQAYL